MQKKQIMIGWREWCILPALNIPAIKMKIDTGARTSCLHAANIEEIDSNYIKFKVDPIQKKPNILVNCEARFSDRRVVINSGGQKELRYVIKTEIEIASHKWEIEMTLTNRKDMTFKMLLGRQAMRHHHIVICPDKSYLQERLIYKHLYNI